MERDGAEVVDGPLADYAEVVFLDGLWGFVSVSVCAWCGGLVKVVRFEVRTLDIALICEGLSSSRGSGFVL